MTKSLKLFFILLFLIASTSTYAQQFTIPELIATLKLNEKKADSLINSKDFNKVSEDKDNEYNIFMYRYGYEIDSVPQFRYLTLGYSHKLKSTHITYSISYKKEAEVIIEWLLKNGYKKLETKITMYGKTEIKVSYRSAKREVLYDFRKKEMNGREITFYDFEVSTYF